MSGTKVLFLDRDGVINRRIVGGYVAEPREFELIPEIIPLLAHARSCGYLLALISNQQGVGKGIMTDAQLARVTSFMQEELSARLDGRGLDTIQYCTDLDHVNSPRRKPNPGMILEVLQQTNAKPELCWFLGDTLSDAQAGRAANVHTALIGSFSPTDATLVLKDHSELHFLADLLH